jgi:hypothetical protein
MGQPQKDPAGAPHLQNVIYLDSRRPAAPKVVAQKPGQDTARAVLDAPQKDQATFPWHRILWPILAVLVLGTISWAAWTL